VRNRGGSTPGVADRRAAGHLYSSESPGSLRRIVARCEVTALCDDADCTDPTFRRDLGGWMVGSGWPWTFRATATGNMPSSSTTPGKAGKACGPGCSRCLGNGGLARPEYRHRQLRRTKYGRRLQHLALDHPGRAGWNRSLRDLGRPPGAQVGEEKPDRRVDLVSVRR